MAPTLCVQGERLSSLVPACIAIFPAGGVGLVSEDDLSRSPYPAGARGRRVNRGHRSGLGRTAGASKRSATVAFGIVCDRVVCVCPGGVGLRSTCVD